MSPSQRLHRAIDALADLYTGGHLLASTEPERLLMLVVEELSVLRPAAERAQACIGIATKAGDDHTARAGEHRAAGRGHVAMLCEERALVCYQLADAMAKEDR